MQSNRCVGYILDDQKRVIPTTDYSMMAEWAWGEEGMAHRRVKQTFLGDGVVDVSTVFLAMDHNFGPDGPPLVFETMVFGCEYDGYQRRYATWEEAERGHAETVAMVREHASTF